MDYLYILTWLCIWNIYGNSIKLLKLSSKQQLILSVIAFFIIFKKNNNRSKKNG